MLFVRKNATTNLWLKVDKEKGSLSKNLLSCLYKKNRTEKKKERRESRSRTPATETRVKESDWKDEDTDIEDLSGAETEACVSSDSDNTIVADDDE